jgi:Ca-activated chloride channel family protein
LLRKIASPVLTNVKFEYLFANRNVSAGDPVNRIYPAESVDLFRGEQLAIVGRYRQSGDAKIMVRGSVAGAEKQFEFAGKFAAQGETPQNRFAEKLWAVRRIGEIIDQIDLNGMNQELVQELVGLSQKHGILTPYTAYLADENQAPVPIASAASIDETRNQLRHLSAADGRGGFAQREAKSAFKGAQNFSADAIQSYSLAEPDVAGAESSQARNAQGLRLENGEALYKRGKIAIAANAIDVDIEKQKSEIVELTRFSDEYFDLVRSNTDEENELLAAQQDDEELVVRLKGKIYRIK